jgi:RNA polymerase sigma-70 factor (ECF subfamily)
VDDAALVARAREGDHAAFTALIERHQAAVHRAALSAVGSAMDADDVAQEALLLAYQRLRSFRGEASFKTWLLTITWNQAMNHRRKSGRWWRRFVSVDQSEREPFEAMPIASSEQSPEDLASAGQLRGDIRRAIAALPHKLRDALLLAQSGDYSYVEIGAMVKAPVGTIKWRVSEARRLIRQQLEARGHGGGARVGDPERVALQKR